jgi:integrase
MPQQLYATGGDSNVPIVVPQRRRRGPSLSRRTGQHGCVVQKEKAGSDGRKLWNPNKPAFGKYWSDTPDGRVRKSVPLGICPTKAEAKRRLYAFIQREGINSKQLFHQKTNPGITFHQQAEKWILQLQTRRRRPVKPATISGYRDALKAWLIPQLGEKSLGEISNATMRDLVEKMSAKNLAAKTIVNYFQVAKAVVASAVDDDGEQIYPRKWNAEFIQLPLIRPEKQHRPTVTGEDLAATLPNAKRKYGVLFALLAGTGLRIGEALGLRQTDFGPECRILHVRRSLWRRQAQEPKTQNAIRAVDVPEALAKILREYIAGIDGYIFATQKGRPMAARNALKVLHGFIPVGFHAFRRFRLTWLRKNGAPKDLERYWMGHAATEVGDLYSKLRDDVAYRQEWAQRIGLGFELVDSWYTGAGTKVVREAA